jgi:hypothetical protein
MDKIKLNELLEAIKAYAKYFNIKLEDEEQ